MNKIPIVVTVALSLIACHAKQAETVPEDPKISLSYKDQDFWILSYEDDDRRILKRAKLEVCFFDHVGKRLLKTCRYASFGGWLQSHPEAEFEFSRVEIIEDEVER
jgi:hypothetical protein